MPTIRIEPDAWQAFLDDFSRRHQSRIVTVEVLDTRIGAQISVRQLPLEGLSLNAQCDEIALAIGDRTDDHIEHVLARPTCMHVKQSDEGFDQVLEIETESEKILLHFD
jgi:hypothetical protein